MFGFAKIEIGADIKKVECDSDRDSDRRSLVYLAGPATLHVFSGCDKSRMSLPFLSSTFLLDYANLTLGNRNITPATFLVYLNICTMIT